MKRAFNLLALLAGACGPFVVGGVFTVTHTGDAGPGSLRQALLDSQPTGPDVIQFNLPGDGPHQIVPLSELPFLNGSVTLDGFTQPGSVPNTLATGMDARWRIQLGESGSTAPKWLVCIRGTNVIRGLDIVGGTVGVELSGADGTVIEGCQFRGTGTGVKVFRGTNTRLGGTEPAHRNVFVTGTAIVATETLDYRIQGNFFGIRRTPTGPVEGNSAGAVELLNSLRGTIGGTEPGAGNLFIGNQAKAFLPNQANAVIHITGPAGASGQDLKTQILGNRIGTDFQGSTDVGNRAGGIHLEANGITVGGVEPGAANLIAHNQGDGVRNVMGRQVAIRGNSIFDNVNPPNPSPGNPPSLGIDLGFDNGVTANDPGDGDGGANRGQNFPVLTLASNTAEGLLILGSLNSVPLQSFTLDFYGNDQCDSSSHGEGQTYLGTTLVVTDASGNAQFQLLLGVSNPGNFIAATATDTSGNTSEFGACREVTRPLGPPLVAVVTSTADSGPGSLRQAILEVNAAVAAESRRIDFKIPGAGVHTIAPLTELPVIVRSVKIDGLSQPGSAANTSINEFNPTLRIRLDGANLTAGQDGLRIEASDCWVQGLIVLRVPGDGIELRGGGGHWITQCLLGWDVDELGRPLPRAQALAGAGRPPLSNRQMRLTPHTRRTEPSESNLLRVDHSTGVRVGTIPGSSDFSLFAIGLLLFPKAIDDAVVAIVVDGSAILLDRALMTGIGEALVVSDTPGLTMANSEVAVAGAHPAVTLAGSPGARITRSRFLDLRIADEIVPPRKEPFILVQGGGSSSPGTPEGCVISDNTFTGNSAFDRISPVILEDAVGQVPPRYHFFNNHFTLGTRATPIDRGGEGWTSNGSRFAGQTAFPDQLAATKTPQGTEITGAIDLPANQSGTVEISVEQRLESGVVALTPAGVHPVTGGPTRAFRIVLASAGDPPPGTRVRVTLTGPNGSTSEYSLPVPIHAAPPSEGAADYGDAPDSYRTRKANSGPAHLIKPGIQLGLAVDPDPDGQPAAFASGDQLDPDGQDEDGVALRLVVDPADQDDGPAKYRLRGQVTASASGWLTISADSNMNGQFEPGESLTRNVLTLQPEPVLVFAGPNPYSFNLGSIAFIPDLPERFSGYRTDPLFVRIRFSTDRDSLLTPVSPDGEVEDHAYLPEDQRLEELHLGRNDDGGAVIAWNGGEAMLQRSRSLQGPWETEVEATSPVVVPDIGEEPLPELFRLLFPPR